MMKPIAPPKICRKQLRKDPVASRLALLTELKRMIKSEQKLLPGLMRDTKRTAVIAQMAQISLRSCEQSIAKNKAELQSLVEVQSDAKN